MKIRTRILTLILTVLMLISALPITAFAATKTEYIKEVRISTAATEDEAKQWLVANGYTVFDFNLNQQSNANAVYLGYITTTDPKEAITDMAVMQMDGGYSFTEYEALLAEQREDINDMLDILDVSLDEARVNLANGNKNAQDAKRVLNYFTEDDSGMALGDFILESDRSRDELVKIFLEGNSDITVVIYYMLAWACTDYNEDTNWLAKLESVDPYEEYDPLDYEAITIDAYQHFVALREKLSTYEERYMTLTDDLEYVETLTPEELTDYFPEDYQEYATLYLALGEYKYGNGTVRDFFMQDPDEIDLDEFYPILSAMSPGQRTISAFIGFEPLIYLSQASEESAAEYLNDCRAQLVAYNIDEGLSVYYGVDRSLFNEGGVALTNASLRESASTGDNSWLSDENIDRTLSMALKLVGGAIGVCGFTTGIAGRVIANQTGKTARAFKMLEESMGSTAYLLGQERKVVLAMQDEMFAKYNVSNMDEFKLLAQTDDLIMADYQKLGSKKINLDSAWDTFDHCANKHADDVYKTTKRGAMKKFAIVQGVAIGINLILTGIRLGIKLYNYYNNREYSVIPRIIVDEIATDTDNYYVRYYAALDQSGEFADLNAWKGQRWNALYTSKDSDAGDPILASGLVAKLKDSSMPTTQSYGVHYFGETGACNLSRYLLKATAPATYMFFTRDHSLRATASAFSKGTVITFASIGAVGGIAIGGFGVVGAQKIKSKKKKNGLDTDEAEPIEETEPIETTESVQDVEQQEETNENQN